MLGRLSGNSTFSAVSAMQGMNGFAGGILLLLSTLIAGCASAPEAPTEAQITDEVVSQATVVAVDKATRELTLQRPDGSRVAVVAGPEVRNFDRLKAGDVVKSRYVVSLSARRLGPDEPAEGPAIAMAAARAEPGENPAGAISAGLTLKVVVKSVDLKEHIVVFAGEDGAVRAVQAERDEGRRFISGLKPGDRVNLVYREVLAVAVE